MSEFDGKRVLVTGGGSGIGRAVARAFAERGASVTITGRRMDALEETAQGHAMTCTPMDVTDEASGDAVLAQPFDIVIANAGAGTPAKVRDMSLALWEDTLRTNLTGVFLTFRGALRHMGPGGRLIAIASTASLQGGANIAAYAASKHGVLGLVRSLAHEVARQGITCNAVCPGFVDTPMAERAVTGLMARHSIDRDTATRMVVGGNPIGRMIAPEEVAGACLYLAAPIAAMVNGHALGVTGGEV